MKVTVDGQVFDYDQNKLLNTEAIALQKVLGMRVTEWAKAMEEGDAYALTGLVWLLWRRDGREVAFDDVEFDLGALETDDEEEEAVPPVPTELPADEAVTSP